MDQQIRDLFDELAELPVSEPEKFFAERRVEPGLRAGVESLLQFDATKRRLLTDCVSNAAEETCLPMKRPRARAAARTGWFGCSAPAGWEMCIRPRVLGKSGAGAVLFETRRQSL